MASGDWVLHSTVTLLANGRPTAPAVASGGNDVRRLLSIIVATVGLVLAVSSAQAATPPEGQAKKPRAPRGVITLETVTIKGRLQQPIAAIDVTRLRPRLTLSELRQPFVDRIGRSVYDAPF
jgi:hypothetical protein